MCFLLLLFRGIEEEKIMKTLYLDCSMGAAGDRLAAALLELMPDAEDFLQELDALRIPDVRVTRTWN